MMLAQTDPPLGEDRNRIKNPNSGTLPEFRFRLIWNRTEFSKFHVPVNKKQDWGFENLVLVNKNQIKADEIWQKKQNKWIGLGVNKQQLSTILEMCVYIVYAYFEYMHVGIRDRGWTNQIKNRKSSNDPEFWFRLIRNRNDISKIRFRLIKNGWENWKSGFGWYEQEIRFRFRFLETSFSLSPTSYTHLFALIILELKATWWITIYATLYIFKRNLLTLWGPFDTY